jgi:hypothetical protein
LPHEKEVFGFSHFHCETACPALGLKCGEFSVGIQPSSFLCNIFSTAICMEIGVIFLYVMRLILENCLILVNFPFYFTVLGFELRAYTLSHSTSLFFVMGFLETGSQELFARAGFKPPGTSNLFSYTSAK